MFYSVIQSIFSILIHEMPAASTTKVLIQVHLILPINDQVLIIWFGIVKQFSLLAPDSRRLKNVIKSFSLAAVFLPGVSSAVDLKTFYFPSDSTINDLEQPYSFNYQANPGWVQMDGDESLVLNLCLSATYGTYPTCHSGYALLQPFSGGAGSILLDKLYKMNASGDPARSVVSGNTWKGWSVQISDIKGSRILGYHWQPAKMPYFHPALFDLSGHEYKWFDLPIPAEAKYGLRIEMGSLDHKGRLSIIGADPMGPGIQEFINLTAWNELQPRQFNASTIDVSGFPYIQAIQSGYGGQKWLFTALKGDMGPNLIDNPLTLTFTYDPSTNSYSETLRNHTLTLASNEVSPVQLAFDFRDVETYEVSNGISHYSSSVPVIDNPQIDVQGRRMLGESPLYALTLITGVNALWFDDAAERWSWLCDLKHLKAFAENNGQYGLPQADYLLGGPHKIKTKDLVVVPVLPVSRPEYPDTQVKGNAYYLVSMTTKEYGDFKQFCKVQVEHTRKVKDQ